MGGRLSPPAAYYLPAHRRVGGRTSPPAAHSHPAHQRVGGVLAISSSRSPPPRPPSLSSLTIYSSYKSICIKMLMSPADLILDAATSAPSAVLLPLAAPHPSLPYTSPPRVFLLTQVHDFPHRYLRFKYLPVRVAIISIKRFKST